MPRQRQRRPRRQEVVEELLQAAARVFAKRGYAGASVEQISDDAGYSTGALYSNFKSKDELFLRLFETRNERRRQELRATVAEAGGGTGGLAAAAANLSATLESEHEWFLLYLEFALRAARDQDFAQHFKARREDALRELTAGITDALGQGGLSASLEPRDLARSVRAISHGFALERVLGESRGSDPLPGEVMRLAFRGSTGDGS